MLVLLLMLLAAVFDLCGILKLLALKLEPSPSAAKLAPVNGGVFGLSMDEDVAC